jgi:outer membrane protein
MLLPVRHIVASLSLLAFALPAAAQDRLSLSQAIKEALAGNPDVQVARATAGEAAQRIPQARAGMLPHVELVESWQRGNQPVSVFGSLLAQRQFSQANFAVDRLNHPDAVSNVRTAITAEQVLFDGGRTGAAVRAASLGHRIALSGQAQAASDLTLRTTEAYGQVLLAAAEHQAAESAVASAEEDARSAGARHDAGTGSEADVLAVAVHLARMRERAIEAASNETIARAELNRLIAAPLDRAFLLEEPAIASSGGAASVTLEQQALAHRPEIVQAELKRDLSRSLARSARAARLPQVAMQGAYEWNDGRLGRPAPAWTVGAQVRLNLFAGGADLARAREAAYGADRADAERLRAETAIRIDVLAATERLKAARAREAVGRAMVMQARESRRMIRDRYEAGMTSVGELLRADNAVLEAETQRTAARVDVIVSDAQLHHAVGGDQENR